MPYIYGRLTCNYIANLMYELDNSGTSIENPFPILDPSRAGINVDHPFIRELYSIPSARIELLLQDLNRIQGVPNITGENVSDLLRNLEMIGNNIIETEEFSSVWKDQAGDALIRAIESQRGQYVKVETNNIQPALHSENPHFVPSSNVNEIQSIRRLSVDGVPTKLVIESEGNLHDINQEKSKSVWEQPLNQSVVPRALVDDFKVKAKKATMNLSINFSVSETLHYRYQIYQSGETIFLNINLRNPVVAKEIQVDPETGNVIGILDKESIILLGEMFIEAMSRLILESYASNNSKLFEGLNSYQTVVKLMREFEKNVLKIEVAIHHVVEGYIKQRFSPTATA